MRLHFRPARNQLHGVLPALQDHGLLRPTKSPSQAANKTPCVQQGAELQDRRNAGEAPKQRITNSERNLNHANGSKKHPRAPTGGVTQAWYAHTHKAYEVLDARTAPQFHPIWDRLSRLLSRIPQEQAVEKRGTDLLCPASKLAAVNDLDLQRRSRRRREGNARKRRTKEQG